MNNNGKNRNGNNLHGIEKGFTPEEERAYLLAKYSPDTLLVDVIRLETAELETEMAQLAQLEAAFEADAPEAELATNPLYQKMLESNPEIQELRRLIDEMDPYSRSRPSLTENQFRELKAAGVTPEEFAMREGVEWTKT